MRARNEVSLSFRHGALGGSAHIRLVQLALGRRFFLTNKPRAWLGAKVFACASVVGAALVFMPIATASEDGIDDFVRVYLLGVWIVGPLLLLIRSRKRAQ